jgi:hypothetical protein
MSESLRVKAERVKYGLITSLIIFIVGVIITEIGKRCIDIALMERSEVSRLCFEYGSMLMSIAGVLEIAGMVCVMYFGYRYYKLRKQLV